MAITVKHKFVSAIPDGADATVVRPSNWNDDHDLTGTIPVANGGTGAATADGAVTNLLPSQTGNNGKVLTTDGTNTSWSTNGVGDVVGPASATDNAIARFDTTTGKLIQDSVVIVGDTGAVTGVTTLSASTSVTTPIVQASNSGGLTLKNASGTTQMSMGAGGGDNMSINVSTNLNGTNAQIDISPTGTGHVHINPSGSGSIEMNPTSAGTINNMVIGGTTAAAGSFTNLSVTGTTSFDGSQGTAGQVLTSAGTGATPTWTTPTTGTVTSVAATVPALFSISGSPITSSGTLAMTYSGTALPAANGGTGQTVYAVGDIVYASTTTALSKLADVATGNALISGGVGVAPSYGKIGLTTHVSGTLPIANGGTNSTATPTAGGAIYGTGTAYAITAAGTTGQVLTSQGASAPTWTTPSSGGGISWQSVKTANFTATSGNAYPVNTTSGAIIVTLPASPTANQLITITDYAGTAATNNILLNPNGNKIQGETGNFALIINRQSVNLVYVDSTQGWVSYADQEVALTPQTPVTYLIVAGAGGGGGIVGGGSGAGGLLAGSSALTTGTTYTITVGAGGSGGNGNNFGSNGSDSAFSTNTAIGGGGGGYNTNNGRSGGSGGGGANSNGGTAGSGASGTSGQGFAGGNGNNNAFPTGAAGGGGGSGSAGSTPSGVTGGAGGNGKSSSITGSAVTYAGGGGGWGGTSAGAGGSGGGGSGSSGAVSANGNSGTTNTGSGGGGAANGGTGGSGGSGVVILSIPTSIYSGTTTGSPTVTTSGSNTILQFNSSGSYTA